jgi:hypothetical protein
VRWTQVKSQTTQDDDVRAMPVMGSYPKRSSVDTLDDRGRGGRCTEESE